MKVLALLVVSFIGLAQTDTSWNTFRLKHNKIYKNQTEHLLREKIFNDNLQKIEEHNKKYEQGLTSYKQGINQFSDLTSEEFGAMFKILQADENNLPNEQERIDLTDNGFKALPKSIDWRTKSVVSEVKNQGTCGSCWTFSTTGAIESHLAIQTGELKPLSKQQLLDCDSRNLGCNGGNLRLAIDYVTANGLALDADYPYLGVQVACSRQKSKDIVVRTKGYVNIIANNETNLKEAIGLVGPVSVAIYAEPLQSYQDGIFDDKCSNVVDHAVLVVGYGKDNQTGVEYWIIKNSWGKTWGEEGYFKLKMGSNLCRVASQAIYPLLKPNSAYSVKGGIFVSVSVFIHLFIAILAAA